uniref:ShKT domain-containing protein n=1 Tax=Panagrolaimus sp. ES5 TaxID=591445 RepID=A0AC34FV19_9BILA
MVIFSLIVGNECQCPANSTDGGIICVAPADEADCIAISGTCVAGFCCILPATAASTAVTGIVTGVTAGSTDGGIICVAPTDEADCIAISGTCVAGFCCILPATAASTIVTGIVTGLNGVTVPGSIGTCFDNECPTGYTSCFDNECPTGYTCNTATQLCCSSTTSSTTTCRDLIGPRGYSDCPARASLCNSTVYYDLMTQQCPRTCNRCTTTGLSSTVSTTCVDLSRANGTSDCPQLAYLCNNTVYYTVMTQQCPRTCGRCTSG